MKYVLIAVLVSPLYNGITSISQDFDSEETCVAVSKKLDNGDGLGSKFFYKVIRNECFKK
jgi:hypothetical protein